MTDNNDEDEDAAYTIHTQRHHLLIAFHIVLDNKRKNNGKEANTPTDSDQFNIYLMRNVNVLLCINRTTHLVVFNKQYVCIASGLPFQPMAIYAFIVVCVSL